jgi:5'-nucleotidase
MTSEDRMRLLLSNDDGIDAPGLDALRAAARSIGEFIVYAPLRVQSGCSHRLNNDTSIPVHRRGPTEVAIDGTPGDCVRLAFHEGAHDADWVLSGINDGGNLGVDVFYSGTVAAVREAAIHGKPGIAFSHYIKRSLPVDWKRISRWTTAVTTRIMAAPQRPGTFWSVNFPHLPADAPEPALVFCPLDTNPLPLRFDPHELGHKYAGVYHDRPRTPGADVDVCFSGNIAITRLSTCHGAADAPTL